MITTLFSEGIQARLKTLELLVSTTLDAMQPDQQITETARLQKRLEPMGDLPELRANVLRAWLDVHETKASTAKNTSNSHTVG